MAHSVDEARAAVLLEAAWNQKVIVLGDNIKAGIAGIIGAPDVTFRYILVTGLLGKVTNPAIHPRALQAGSVLEGAYDARSLCHHVIVPFEKSKGDLFGLSNEPFLNKPARHPQHDKANDHVSVSVITA